MRIKIIVLLVIIPFLQDTFCQITFKKILDIKWEETYSGIQSLFVGKVLTEEKVLQFNGLSFQDTLETFPVKVAMLFSSNKKLIGKSIGAIKNGTNIEKLYSYLKLKSIELFGNDYKENSTMGMNITQWQLNSGEKVILSFKKENSNLMLAILKF